MGQFEQISESIGLKPFRALGAKTKKKRTTCNSQRSSSQVRDRLMQEKQKWLE